MLYVSSSCVKAECIGGAIQQLFAAGFTSIELSGGTAYEEDISLELLALKKSKGIELVCHNYFPPPKVPFVLNLASLDAQVAELSLAHVLRALALTRQLGARQYSFHAGFLIDVPVESVGKPLSATTMFDRDKALAVFEKNLTVIKEFAHDDIALYVENNVLSAANLHAYGGANPFLMTDANGIEPLLDSLDIALLLDVAHLKVSAHSLNLCFERELGRLLPRSQYIHVSDNDGLLDSNRGLKKVSALYGLLESQRDDLLDKTISLEVYEGLDCLRESYDCVKELINE